MGDGSEEAVTDRRVEFGCLLVFGFGAMIEPGLCQVRSDWCLLCMSGY